MMHIPSHTFDLVMLAVDLGLALYLLVKLYPVLKTARIEKHARFPGCTRAGDPWSYWGITLSSLLGVAILLAGSWMRLHRLLGP